MNRQVYTGRPASGIPTIIFILLISNGLVFVLQQMSFEFMMIRFALWPATPSNSPFMPWQLLTYGFLHGDLMHIAFNMFALWMFGQDLERLWGPQRFLTYFLVCVVGAGLVQLVVAGWQGGLYPTVGASGGVFGILLAFGLTFPNRMVMLIFPPIPMRAITAVFVFGALELYFGFSGAAPGIANFAHLGGMMFGFLTLRYWRGRR
ncbi:MAG: rhomboid family intramembrane serine protease [Gammaproteobacteria bacterium]|nr:rhomboid family intramembrane serine protease [Gammaproteobacteria bacterium]NNF48276.1 rhomboid family intramembrane serine protease [Woeseiaceae bacterium]MBT8093889.1 rhomboid family intramembrane serine protease [Gammaproteobacteria bacterium]MBT8104459.1 rhomboid family intramembrane serine protease [Gammaproteobacteria bacterium]NNK24475.1 rhomboid family intramembrane serine protease [Woeseiaceae bacterium]